MSEERYDELFCVTMEQLKLYEHPLAAAGITTPSYLAVSGRLAGELLFLSSPWQLLLWRLGWKDCCWCSWLLLDLLVISRMLCPTREILSMQNKEQTELTMPFCCYAGQSQSFQGQGKLQLQNKRPL